LPGSPFEFPLQPDVVVVGGGSTVVDGGCDFCGLDGVVGSVVPGSGRVVDGGLLGTAGLVGGVTGSDGLAGSVGLTDLLGGDDVPGGNGVLGNGVLGGSVVLGGVVLLGPPDGDFGGCQHHGHGHLGGWIVIDADCRAVPSTPVTVIVSDFAFR
jgi:hypothetical protein